MRLIDADNFLERFEKMCETETDNVIAAILRGVLINEPTAYDINKVVEELKNASWEETDISTVIYIDDAIEIVKQCGVSDDVCERKLANDGEFIQNPHTKRLYSNEPSMKNVYCNTCGKKIKVVGD